MKRRILSIITALALCLSLCPTWAFAVEGEPDTGLCDHHPEHIGCGYAAPTEGHDCGHEHTEDCYTTDEAGGEVLDCHHSHDSECGYVQADPGTSCGYVCNLCPIEDLIAALPEQVTEDNAADVRGQLDHILALFGELNEDEQEEINLSRCYALQAALDEANAPMTANGSTEQQDTDEASVEMNGTTTYYATLEEAFTAVNGQTATITMLTNAECSKETGSNSSPLVISGGKVTLNLNEKTLSGKGSGYHGIIDVTGGSLLVQGEEGKVNVTMTGLSCRGSGKLTVEGITLELVGDNIGVANAGVENSGGTVVLNGTQITGAAADGQIYHYSGTTTINNVTATGTMEKYPKSVWYDSEGTLKINGGTFDKIVVNNYDNAPTIAGLLGEGCAYKKQGGTWATDDELAGLEISNVTVAKIPLTIHPQGDTSWYYSTQQTHTLAMNAAPVDSGNSVSYVWKSGEETLDCTSDAYTVPTGMPVGSYTYTCEATCDGYTLSHMFTFKIEKSGTDLTSDGKVKTYNGETQTDTFTASDIITVKATPTATGTAPQKAAARLRGSYTAPTAGQMALFVGDIQVCEPVEAGADGTYTMTVSAADVLLAAGGPGTGITLTARFTANDNMADGAGTVKVNITAAAKAERDGNVIDYFGVSDFEGINGAFFKDAYAGATVALLDDITPASDSTTGKACSTAVSITCTLDLAGHNFTSTDIAIYVLPGGNLTIQDSSTGKTGTVSSIKSDGTLKLYGGTFGKIETAYTLSSLLAENCAYYKGSTPILLSELEGQKTLDGTVTVQECQHKDVTPTSNNDGTHTLSCPYCGYTKAAENCDYGEYTHNDTSHTRICKLCGYQNVEAHNIKCTAEASGTVIAVSEACKTCGYGKDLGTVTIHIPKLVYGNLTGVVTAETTLTETVVVAVVVDNNSSGSTVIFPFDPPTMATLTGNALLSAGTHQIKIEIIIDRDDDNELADCLLPFTVDPAPLTADMVTLGQTDVTYKGTEQKPALSVKQGETPLTEGTDYEVSYTRDGVVTNDFTSAGTVNITVTAKGNYTGSVEKTYTIGKATPKIEWANSQVELTYTGQPADIKPVITLVNGEEYKGEIHYSWGVVADSLVPPTDAQNVSIMASIPEQGNYLAAESGWLILYINKANQDAPDAPTADGENIKDTSITLNTIENAEYKRDDGEWQENPTFTGLEPNQAYTFYARLKADRNHNASTSSAGTSITTRKAMLENASVTITGTYTYTGASIVPEAGNVEVVLNGTKIDSDQYTISASNNIDAGVGKATLTVTATETGNYSGSVSSTFTISKATLYVAPNSQTIHYGESIREGASAILTRGLATGDHVVGVTLTPDTKDVPGGRIIASEVQIQNESGADVTGNYEITYVPGALIINKSQPTIAFADGYNPGKTYDGQTIPNPVEANLTITGATFGDVAFAWSATPKNAGTYTLTASIPVTDNTEAAEAVLTVTISPKAVTPTITITPDSYKYTGSAIHPSGSAVKVMDGDTVIPDSEYTLSYGENTQVGQGSVIVTDKENGNYTIARTTGTFAITKADQAPLTITGAPGSVTYGDTFQLGVSGGSGTGALSWAASGATVDNAGNVTITRAGTVAITAVKEGDSNYVGTEGRIMLDVSKKALTVTGATAQDRQYDGTSAVKITGVTLEGIVNGDTVSVSTANLTGTLNGSNAGSYTAVTLPALSLTGGGADNYTLTRPAGAVSTSVTISKADALTPKTGDLAVANKQAHTYTFGLGALRPDLPAGMSFGSSAVTYELGAVSLGSYYGGSGAKIEGQTLTLPIQAVESNEAEGIGTITVTIKSDNFEDMTATINVRSVNKTIPTGAPTLSAATLTYGQPLSTITLRGDMAAGATPVPGTFTWSSPDNRPAVQEAYAAAWVFTPTDNNTYAIVNGTSTIKVVPASVAGSVVTLSPTSFRYDGQTHSPTVTSVKLGDTTLTEDTDYTVEIPTETAAGTYAVTVTGKGNYTGTATATFTINPVEQKPLDQTDDDGHELRLEVETGLSTVPEALKNNTKYDTPAKIEAELRTQVEQVMSNVGENIAVFDVTLQYKDESGTWHTVDPNDFPAEGVTAILPYPDGTGATGYTFTVQHLISSGAQAGTMETLSYTLTADGLQCKFLSLSPVAIGYQAAAKPVDPVNPNPGGGSGGWSGVSTYAVTIEKSEHGKVTSNRTNAGNGSTVTLTVTPEDGYVLDTLTVTDSRGNAIKLTAQGNGKYTFTMPGRAVMVRAAFAPLPDGTACDGGEGCPSRGFTDLGSVGTWYHEAVDYVLRNNLMGGYGNGLFGPNNTLTRAQFAQILFNKEGRPVVNYLLQFTDVSGEAWYTEAVRWAASQGIVGGYADGRFGPNDNITREQLAVMLWRYAGSPAATDKELHFNDADKVGAYARDAMRWAVENGVISGKGGGILDPKGLATRAQTAQMLKNYLDGQSE